MPTGPHPQTPQQEPAPATTRLFTTGDPHIDAAVGGNAFYDLTVDCWGLNRPFGGAPAIGPYSYTVSTLASGPNVTAHCAMGAGIAGVVTNAYITPRDI
ncbi:hypothetical protein [Nocardia sp. CC227C]|uniref:hypothetical protein n=1 Tax=Nocardia sp. CC227C TaxID=3044562 RepID=UPI00278C04A2|nr:hypothetical protein [Nocardia sp. CC227C]